MRRLGLAALAVVRDLREHWAPASAEELERFETDVLSGFVLARASAGLADGTIRGDVGHLDQIRTWFDRPLWDMEPADADAYFGKVLRHSPSGTRLGRSQALSTYFMFLELRHKIEIHRMTGRVVECPIAARRVGDDALRNGLDNAVEAHLPSWTDRLTPHVLRHFCASQLYGNGLDLLAIQEVLGHSWIATTMRYIHVQQTRVEDAWVAGMERAAKRLEGLAR